MHAPTGKKIKIFMKDFHNLRMYYSWVPNRRPTLLINFSIFSTQDILIQISLFINYWGKFPTQTKLLKQTVRL